MKNLRNIICVICHVLFCTMALVNGSENDERKPYIVYMGHLPENNGAASSVMDDHHNILSDIMGEELARKSRIHSYGKSFNAFAAHLLPQEAEKLKENKNVVSVFPDKTIKLITTYTWDYIGMPVTVKRLPQVESDTIVAVLDSGIYADSPSFDGKGFGPPPKKWKGACEPKSVNFTGCNNKLIGAQYFEVLNSSKVKDYDKNMADYAGHGTHTASTAAGNAVPGTSLFGIAEGTARGGVPSARLAIYKICFLVIGCNQINMLAAFDKAISDGVDIISLSAMSVGGSKNFFEDGVAIGAFHAQKKGIPVVCGGGNDGPELHTVANVAPWVTTVGANGHDKEIKTLTKLGNGKVYSGISINTFEPDKQMYPLTNGILAKNASNTKDADASGCNVGALSEEKVKGAIVYCTQWTNGQTISELHGAGTISRADEISDYSSLLVLPGLQVNKSDGESINQYITSTKSPTAVIYKSVVVNRTTPSPDIASFSSRGPQSVTLNILKPDIVAPGVNILAGYTQLYSLTATPEDKRFVKYTIMSGTSMSTPHVTGATAFVKTFHPEWSPAAIKSALMTTAKPIKVQPIGGALATGSGMINPVEALNPGLIYDIGLDSYVSFLCKEGYNSTTLAILTGNNSYDCSKVKPANGADGLNYPSMHLQLPKQNSTTFSTVFYRAVTNVGEGVSLYKANIQSPKELSISVVPKILSFTKPNQVLPFRVDVNGKFVSETAMTLEASLVWSDSSNHNVRSPILVYRNTTGAPH